MRAIKRFSRAGFTLVELMIVVAIIGILAALAIYGVRRYLQSAKTSEAKNSLGAIGRGAIGAYEREDTPPEALTEGIESTQFTHNICGGAGNRVPSSAQPPTGKKYQPSGVPDTDYDTGNAQNGWKCLKFTMTNPQYYAYGYQGDRVGASAANGAAVLATNPVMPALAADGDFMGFAHGDLDGDSNFSGFAIRGSVTASGIAKLNTELDVRDEFE